MEMDYLYSHLLIVLWDDDNSFAKLSFFYCRYGNMTLIK